MIGPCTQIYRLFTSTFLNACFLHSSLGLMSLLARNEFCQNGSEIIRHNLVRSRCQKHDKSSCSTSGKNQGPYQLLCLLDARGTTDKRMRRGRDSSPVDIPLMEMSSTCHSQLCRSRCALAAQKWSDEFEVHAEAPAGSTQEDASASGRARQAGPEQGR